MSPHGIQINKYWYNSLNSRLQFITFSTLNQFSHFILLLLQGPNLRCHTVLTLPCLVLSFNFGTFSVLLTFQDIVSIKVLASDGFLQCARFFQAFFLLEQTRTMNLGDDITKMEYVCITSYQRVQLLSMTYYPRLTLIAWMQETSMVEVFLISMFSFHMPLDQTNSQIQLEEN